MPWTVFIPLLIQYGFPLAEDLFNKWTSGGNVTAADIADLKAKLQVTAQDQMKARLTAAGIPLDDPKAVALLALAQ